MARPHPGQADVVRVSGGYRVALKAIPRAAVIRATFDGSDPHSAPEVEAPDIDTPKGATELRVVAEVGGAFGPEERARLGSGLEDPGEGGPTKTKPILKPDSPARLVSRFEPKDTAAAFSALDRLAKIPDAKVEGGSVDLNGQRSEIDYLARRLGSAVAIPADGLDKAVKELVRLLDAPQPAVKLRIDAIAFPSGRDLTSFCDASGEDFDRVQWKQD